MVWVYNDWVVPYLDYLHVVEFPHIIIIIEVSPYLDNYSVNHVLDQQTGIIINSCHISDLIGV